MDTAPVAACRGPTNVKRWCRTNARQDSELLRKSRRATDAVRLTDEQRQSLDDKMHNWSYCPHGSAQRKEWFDAICVTVESLIAAAIRKGGT